MTRHLHVTAVRRLRKPRRQLWFWQAVCTCSFEGRLRATHGEASDDCYGHRLAMRPEPIRGVAA